MCVVDSNILMHASILDSTFHPRSRSAMESYAAASEPWAVTSSILYEFLRITTHSRVFPHPLTIAQADAFNRNLLSVPGCSVLGETAIHGDVMASCLGEAHRLTGNLLHNFHIAVLMREHGIEHIVSLDTDFRAFPWTKVSELP